MSGDRSRQERRAARSAGEIDNQAFAELADAFIDLANRQNRKVPATQLHMAFLYASARYSAHVARNVLDVEKDEPFVEAMLRDYAEMLRQHLADPSI